MNRDCEYSNLTSQAIQWIAKPLQENDSAIINKSKNMNRNKNMRPLVIIVLSALLLRNLVSRVDAQGTVRFNNLANDNPSPSATSSGLVFIWGYSGGPELLNEDVNFLLLGGSEIGHLAPVHYWLLSDNLPSPLYSSAKGISVGGGQFRDPSGGVYPVPGVYEGSNAILQIYAWKGTVDNPFLSISLGATAPFFNPTGRLDSPPTMVPDMSAMPALAIGVPEPPTTGLAGLLLAGWLVFHRHKSRQTG